MLSIQCIHAHTPNRLTQASPLPPASCLRPARRAGSTNRPNPPALGCPMPATDPEKELESQAPWRCEDLGGLFLVRSAGPLRGRILILELSRLLGVASGVHMAVEGFRVSVLKGKSGAFSVWVAVLYLLSPHFLDGCTSWCSWNVP